MAWTYSGNPSQSAVDAVRFEIQDTVKARPLLQDEEIEYAITQEAGDEPDAQGLLSAAARCCEALGRKFTAEVDTLIGSLQVTCSKQAANYNKMAADLRVRAQGQGPVFVGAQSRSEKRALRQDRDRVQPLFRRGQHQVPQVQGGGEEILPGGGLV